MNKALYKLLYIIIVIISITIKTVAQTNYVFHKDCVYPSVYLFLK